MENHTFITEFHFLLFSDNSVYRAIFFGFFLVLFLIGMLINLAIIASICSEARLQNPMYFFLCNLSCLDILAIVTTVPLLLDMLSTGENNIYFVNCFTQMYFFILASGTENIILVTMAYDRYVAICNPLRYHHILNRKYCALLSIVTWVIGCLNSLMLTTSALKMYFCHNNVIKHYFCEANALKRIACAGREAFYSVVYFDLFFMGLCPVLCCLTSYAKIIRVIMSIKSKEGRQKTFSTCSSHAIVIFIYFGSGTLDYVMSLLEISGFQEEVLTVLYANVTPLLNPLIYSLRNKELKQGLQKVLGKMLTV